MTEVMNSLKLVKLESMFGHKIHSGWVQSCLLDTIHCGRVIQDGLQYAYLFIYWVLHLTICNFPLMLFFIHYCLLSHETDGGTFTFVLVPFVDNVIQFSSPTTSPPTQERTSLI